MMIRVLQIIPTLVRGGAEKQLTLLATGLPPDEFESHVAVLTCDGPYHDPLRAAEIPVTLINKAWKFDPAAYFRLSRLIRQLCPNIVHTWLFAANSYGRQAAFANRVPRVVAGERCADRWKAWHELAIDRYLARRTDRIAVNSSGVRDFYVERGIDPAKFVLIPNGVEPLPASPQRTREELLRELNLPPDARLIGAVGRLWPQKRYKDLIWSAELLRAGRGDVYLLIAGDGPQRAALQRYCEQIKVGRHVQFLGERGDVPQLLPHLSCFWLGSGYEGQSNGLLEAMAAGLPVVASDIPGNRDLVVHGQTGYLVPVGDVGEIARKTHQLLENPSLAQELGQRGQARVSTEFSVERMVQRYAALYRELAGRS